MSEIMTSVHRREPHPEFAPLMKFYAVTTTADLIRAMEGHISSLQAKLPKIEPWPNAAPRVREG